MGPVDVNDLYLIIDRYVWFEKNVFAQFCLLEAALVSYCGKTTFVIPKCVA